MVRLNWSELYARQLSSSLGMILPPFNGVTFKASPSHAGAGQEISHRRVDSQALYSVPFVKMES